VAAAAAAPRYAWLNPAPGVDLADEQPAFLRALNSVGATLRRVIDVFSGYRTPAHSVAVGGTANDPHTQGVAVDATVGGVPIGRVRGAQAAIANAGLVSGDQPGFFHGQPDPSHVQAGAPTATRGGGAYAQLQALWVAAGGSASAAATMAAVALAESHGNAHAHNGNAGTGDDSYGLWQINYYGDLRASRTARFGPPEGLYNPAKNARAAVSIFNSSGPDAWSTYKSGAYKTYLGGGGASATGSIRTRPDAGGGGGVGGFFGDVAGGIEGAAEGGWKALVSPIDGPLAIVKAALWLLNPRSWLRATEFVVGLGLMLLGLLGLATVFAARNPAVRKAATVAALAPGPVGAVGRGVSVAGATRGASAVPARARDRYAREQGRQQARVSEQRQRSAKARQRGRKGQQARASSKAFRVEHPDFDVIPF
jgi:hypothetical protein